MDLQVIWTEKFEEKLRRSLIECVAYTEIDPFTWHPAYVEANQICNRISKKNKTIGRQDIEIFVWNKLERIQQWLVEEQVKNPMQNWKLILGSKKSVYIQKLDLYIANPEYSSNSLNEDVYGNVKDFFGKVILLLRESGNPFSVIQKIKLFHCINLFSHIQLGETTISIWRSFFDSSGQFELSSNDFEALRTLTDLDNFLEGRECLFCKEGGSENSSVPVKNIGEHVKNCHSFKTIPCSIADCNVLLATKKLLNSHLKKFHKIENLHHCPICDTNFSSKLNLTLHENDVHKKGKRIRRKHVASEEDSEENEDDENELSDQKNEVNSISRSTSSSGSLIPNVESSNLDSNLEELSKQEIISRFRDLLAVNASLREENLKLRSELNKENVSHAQTVQSIQDESQVTPVEVINLVPQDVDNEIVSYQIIYPEESSSFEPVFQTIDIGEAIPGEILNVVGEEQIVAYESNPPNEDSSYNVNEIPYVFSTNDPEKDEINQISEEKENQEKTQVDLTNTKTHISPDKQISPEKLPSIISDENCNRKRNVPAEVQVTACRSRAPFVGLFKKQKTSFR